MASVVVSRVIFATNKILKEPEVVNFSSYLSKYNLIRGCPCVSTVHNNYTAGSATVRATPEIRIAAPHPEEESAIRATIVSRFDIDDYPCRHALTIKFLLPTLKVIHSVN